jgi:hypothetical protein
MSFSLDRMLWETKSDGAFRRVRLTARLAIKTPYVFKFKYLFQLWRRAQSPISLSWWLREWRELFYEGCKHNQQEARRWKQIGTQEVNGVSLCPVLYSQRWGLLVIMRRAAPLGRPVSMDEDMTAIGLIGKAQDTGRESTFGIIADKIVIVDYGWWIRTSTLQTRS